MTTLTEGNLQITFPRTARVRKFDDEALHGLSHCMMAVDFIVEEDDRVLFIELKDPEHPRARERDRANFIDSFRAGRLEKNLKYKYRDSFLYEWASGNTGKPIHYWVIVAIEDLTDVELLSRTDALSRNLPSQGPTSGRWERLIVSGCMVFNIRTWNEHLRGFPLSRVPT